MNTIHSKYHQDLILLPNNQLTAEHRWRFWILVCQLARPTPAHFDSTVSSKYLLVCVFCFSMREEKLHILLVCSLDEVCMKDVSATAEIRVQFSNFLFSSSTRHTEPSTNKRTAAVNTKMSANYQHMQCKVWDAFRYILSWYNPHFWVFRSVRLQRCYHDNWNKPKGGQGSAYRVGHTSALRKQGVILDSVIICR